MQGLMYRIIIVFVKYPVNTDKKSAYVMEAIEPRCVVIVVSAVIVIVYHLSLRAGDTTSISSLQE